MVAFVLTFAAAMQPATASSANDDEASRLELAMTRTLDANPGSVQISENVIMREDGVVIGLPRADGTSSLDDCPSGYQCGWVKADFQGPFIGGLRCVYIDYYNVWYWVPETNTYHNYANKVSSLFNNIPGVTWSQFWSPRNNANYDAHVGAPANYVGDRWNDSFTAAQGCSGQVH